MVGGGRDRACAKSACPSDLHSFGPSQPRFQGKADCSVPDSSRLMDALEQSCRLCIGLGGLDCTLVADLAHNCDTIVSLHNLSAHALRSAFLCLDFGIDKRYNVIA